MEEEKLFSGYCRQIDGSRRVWVEYQGTELLGVDCAYGNCPFQGDCEIGKGIAALTGDAPV